MSVVVLDTSALIRLYIPDGPVPLGLESHVEAASLGNVLLMSPDLLLAEVAQVLHRKTSAQIISQAESDDILEAILRLPLELAAHRALLEASVRFARQYRLTVYDALFCTLALDHRAELVTCDVRLSKAFLYARDDTC